MKKNKVFSVLMTSALVTSALVGGTAEAAATQKQTTVKNPVSKTAQTKLKVAAVQLIINGSIVSVNAVQINQTSLVALTDLVKAFGAGVSSSKGIVTIKDASAAHTIQLQAGSKSYKLDGQALAFTLAPVVQDGKTYIELKPVVEALGGEVSYLSGAQQVFKVKRLEGSFSSVHWNGEGNVVAGRDDAGSAQMYKFNPNDYSHVLISTDENASELAVSPNGQWGAYTDNTGLLHLMALASGQSRTLGTDTSIKTDLIWSADGTKIYFIQGDKQEKLSYISIDTGKITEILADKVENKSDVSISADEKKLIYIVNVTGVANSDKDSTEESLTIDYSGAGGQLYSLDLTAKDAKPVQLTTSKDNKLYPALLSDGRAVYLSADTDNINSKDVIKAITADGKIQDLFNDVDVILSTSGSSGILAVAGTAADGSTKIFTVGANGAKQEVYSTDGTVEELSISPDGSQIAAIEDGKVIVVYSGKTVQLTK